MTTPPPELPSVEPDPPEPCNYSAPQHEGDTRYFAPGWRCTLHTPGVIRQQHDRSAS